MLAALADALTPPGGTCSYAGNILACQALAELDLTASLAGARTPVLVAAGEHDEVITPASARATAGAMPGAEYRVVTGCGHLPPAEDPAAVAQMLTCFFSDRESAHPSAPANCTEREPNQP